MARYTGPKQKLLVNLAKRYSETIKLSKITLLDNTGWLKRGKNLNMLFINGKAKTKYSYGILENNSEVYSKASATKGVTGEVFYNCVKQD
jgi:hypothetical protein